MRGANGPCWVALAALLELEACSARQSTTQRPTPNDPGELVHVAFHFTNMGPDPTGGWPRTHIELVVRRANAATRRIDVETVRAECEAIVPEASASELPDGTLSAAGCAYAGSYERFALTREGDALRLWYSVRDEDGGGEWQEAAADAGSVPAGVVVRIDAADFDP